ncbi:NAD-dependent epimerase/dehydratase family protein [Roseivivax sp. CAU 1761]
MPQTAGTGTILLLGAGGRVGRLLRAAWPGPAAPVWVSRTAPGALRWQPGDPVSALPRVRTVAALWGAVPVPGADLADNARLARAAMALGAELGARLVIHCSSAAVYRPGPAALRETDAADPPSAYGAAKLDMERAIAEERARRPAGPRAVALRIGNVAGAESLAATLYEGGPVTLDRFASGAGPVRSYIAPADLARVLLALDAAEPERVPALLNVAAPRPTAMAALAAAAGREIRWRPAPPGAAERVQLDTARLAALCPLPADAAAPEHLLAGWCPAPGGTP